MINSKTKHWLLKNKATIEEVNIYNIASECDQPFKNKDIREVHHTSVTNIHGHLIRMVMKGIIIRHSYQSYCVAKPE